MKYSPELAQANTILCLEIFYAKAKKNIPSPHVRLRQATRTDPLVDGTPC